MVAVWWVQLVQLPRIPCSDHKSIKLLYTSNQTTTKAHLKEPLFPQPFPPPLHPSTRIPSAFHTKFAPSLTRAGAFYYIDVHIHAQKVCALTQTLKWKGSIRSKPQEGRWWIRDKLAAWSPACSLVHASCHGSSTPGEPESPLTSGPWPLMYQDFCRKNSRNYSYLFY